MGNYKPHANSMSALKLAGHLAVVEILVFGRAH
jgi:hypothetical protein